MSDEETSDEDITSHEETIQRYLEVLDHWITRRPVTVVAIFFVITIAFVGGLGQITTDTGTEDFSEEVPEFDVFEKVNEEFGATFDDTGGSTQLIHRGENVVSKKGLLRMLKLQERLEESSSLRVESTSSVAQTVARTLDPEATTVEEMRRAVEDSSESEVRDAVRDAANRPGVGTLLSDDYNQNQPYASATIGTVRHAIPTGGVAADVDTSMLTSIQLQADRVSESVGGEIVVFGTGITENEFGQVIGDSLAIVIPVVVILLLLFLVVAYRDPIDLLLAVVALVMTLIWTFGFMGFAGIAFNQMMIAVPPLLLAIGIDFGIHVVNRYREERVTGLGIVDGMGAATEQLLVAFFIVTATTVFGFGSNMVSLLPPIRSFGVVASTGITFTFLIFGIFVPAAKVYLDQAREDSWFPDFGNEPLGGSSVIGDALNVGTVISDKAPVLFLLFVLLVSLGAGVSATNVDTTFEEEDFLPPDETPWYLDYAPESLQPGEYTASGTVDFLEDNFESGRDDRVTVYVQGSLRQDYALESMARAGEDPPTTFVSDGRSAESESILNVIEDHAERDEEFAALVERNDVNGNGVPDRNLGEIYDYLLSSESRPETLRYMTEEQDGARVIYSVESDAEDQFVTEDAWEVAGKYRMDATPTGNVVVFQAVSDVIFDSAISALLLAILLTAVFLLGVYHVLERRASLGIANLVPILVTVVLLVGTMPVVGVPFNALTATILAITIGVGIAYSVHIAHRFIDEYNETGETIESLSTTMRGTGGALTGSMLTTIAGGGSLILAITPILGQFGFLMAISVVYSYITAMVVLPPTLVVWERFFG